ncbi:MAG: SpoIIE family protein phosphatase [Sphaerochaeta sp.]|nr:SpoIIE family protein phosphatase [Sphaerochaeta sp.]
MNRQSIDQICYKILLPIGESLDLKKMLGRSLALYIGELDCSMGAVLLVDGKEASSFSLSNAFSIPRNIEKQPSFIALRQELLHHDFSDDIITHPIRGKKGIFYVMSISDIGLLVLFKSEGEIDANLLEALRPINHKLGTACKACRQNTELQKSSKQFMEMANMLPGLIIELDNEYKVTFFNKRTQEIFKQIDSDEFHPQSIFDFFPSSSKKQVLELLHHCERGETMISGDFWMKNSREQSFMVNLTISPITGDNSIIGFRGIAIDITNRIKLEKDLQLRDRLSNAITLATQELLKSPDYTQALPHTLELLGKATAMDSVNYFKNAYDQEGVVQKVIRQTQWFANGQTFPEDSFEIPSIQIPFILQALRKKQVFQAVTRTMQECVFKTHLQNEGIKAFITLPIFTKKTFWGFLGFSDCSEEHIWSTVECDLLQLFAISISESIERKQAEDELSSIYQEIMNDLEIAQSVQSYMLPPWLLIDDRILFSANYTPWATIGGDLFDCVRLSDTQYILYIADISGHGIQAALTMTAVKSIINLIIRSDQNAESPAKILTQLNATLSKRLFKDNYMTMCYCLLDFETMSLTSLNAGHPPFFLHNLKTKSTRILDFAGSIPLGWIEDYVYQEKDTISVPFTKDDVICLITDGVFECFNDRHEELGQDQFLALLHQDVQLDTCIMLPHVCYDLINSKGYTKRNDDYSFIAMQAIPEEENSKHFYREIASQLAQVDTVAAEAEAFIIAHGGSDMQGLRTRLVTSEFLSNIVEHGLPKNDAEKIALEIQFGSNIKVVIRDSAVAWDPPEKEPVVSDFFDLLNEEANDRGRGLQIIYAMTSSFARQRIHEINETTFIITED